MLATLPSRRTLIEAAEDKARTEGSSRGPGGRRQRLGHDRPSPPRDRRPRHGDQLRRWCARRPDRRHRRRLARCRRGGDRPLERRDRGRRDRGRDRRRLGRPPAARCRDRGRLPHRCRRTARPRHDARPGARRSSRSAIAVGALLLLDVIIATVLQRLVPDEERGRAMGMRADPRWPRLDRRGLHGAPAGRSVRGRHRAGASSRSSRPSSGSRRSWSSVRPARCSPPVSIRADSNCFARACSVACCRSASRRPPGVCRPSRSPPVSASSSRATSPIVSTSSIRGRSRSRSATGDGPTVDLRTIGSGRRLRRDRPAVVRAADSDRHRCLGGPALRAGPRRVPGSRRRRAGPDHAAARSVSGHVGPNLTRCPVGHRTPIRVEQRRDHGAATHWRKMRRTR